MEICSCPHISLQCAAARVMFAPKHLIDLYYQAICSQKSGQSDENGKHMAMAIQMAMAMVSIMASDTSPPLLVCREVTVQFC